MSILNRFYCLQVKNFFRNGLTECACATSPESLSLWYDLQEMFTSLERARVDIERVGYKLRYTQSWNEEESKIIYQVRYENPSGRAIVMEVWVKHIEGLPTGTQYII